ncbi:MAG: transposase [Halobacteriota archaeon]
MIKIEFTEEEKQALDYERYNYPDPRVLRKMNALWLKSQEMSQHRTTIEEYFREHPPASVKEAMAKIEELTGIKRSENRVREFLKSIRMAPRKVGMIPAKADPEVQESFLKEEMEPRLEEAREGQRVVFFVDAAHFVLAPFLGILWCISPYSPNLNLIERLWKFVKKKCLYSRYYSEFKDFKKAISNCLNQTDTTYKQELDSLLTLRFQSFEKAQSVVA